MVQVIHTQAVFEVSHKFPNLKVCAWHMGVGVIGQQPVAYRWDGLTGGWEHANE